MVCLNSCNDELQGGEGQFLKIEPPRGSTWQLDVKTLGVKRGNPLRSHLHSHYYVTAHISTASIARPASAPARGDATGHRG